MSDFVEMQLVAMQRDVERERIRVREEHLAEETERRIQARREASRPDLSTDHALERFVQRSSRPRQRRWRDLDKFDQELDRLEQRHADALRRVTEAEASLLAAPADDARRYAEWLAAGEKGEKPGSSLQDRTVERDGCRAFADGIALELDKLLQRRVDHVEKHRDRMLEDVRKDIEAARAKYDDLIRALPAARAALLEARELLLWVARFPEPVESFGFVNAVALGLAEPVRQTLGTRARVEYGQLTSLLEKDAQTLAETVGPETKQALGAAGPRVPTREAMWSEDDDYKAWAKDELERAREMGRNFGDVERLGRDVDAIR